MVQGVFGMSAHWRGQVLNQNTGKLEMVDAIASWGMVNAIVGNVTGTASFSHVILNKEGADGAIIKLTKSEAEGMVQGVFGMSAHWRGQVLNQNTGKLEMVDAIASWGMVNAIVGNITGQ